MTRLAEKSASERTHQHRKLKQFGIRRQLEEHAR